MCLSFQGYCRNTARAAFQTPWRGPRFGISIKLREQNLELVSKSGCRRGSRIQETLPTSLSKTFQPSKWNVMCGWPPQKRKVKEKGSSNEAIWLFPACSPRWLIRQLAPIQQPRGTIRRMKLIWGLIHNWRMRLEAFWAGHSSCQSSHAWSSRGNLFSLYRLSSIPAIETENSALL